MGVRKFDSRDRPTLGPSVASTPLWDSGKRTPLLSDDERARLSVIASVVRYNKGMKIYREGHVADAVFNIVSGLVKAYRTLPGGTEHITAFLFADDWFGLPEEGRYVNSAKAVTVVTAYRVPVAAMESQLQRDATLDLHVIAKLCHELREAQRHAILLGRRSAVARVAMLLQLLERHQKARGENTHELYLPMSRSDVASYVGMSLEAVSRSLRTLASRGVISFKGRRYLEVVDRAQFEALAVER